MEHRPVPFLLALLLLQTPSVETHAREVVAELAAKDFAKIEAVYSPDMKKVLPPGALATSWTAMVAQFGAFDSVGDLRVETSGTVEIAVMTCHFAQYDATLRVAFNAAGELTGLSATNPTPRAAWSPPPYVDASAFTERPITVQSGRWELPGIVTVPKAAGPHPAIVLVHGSGPNDMDESIGPNRMFKDLAQGLASRGVVVLRYEKRAHKYGAKSTDDEAAFTVKEEVMDDAASAVAVAATLPEVDRTRIFLAGHSEGGYLAPRMAAAIPAIKGIILLAGNVRPIEELMVEQIQYQARLAGPVTPQVQKVLDAVEASRNEMTDPNLKPGMTVHVMQSALPASYVLDLRTYHPDAAAAALSIPMFILQGERDYQVTMRDFDLWKAALASHANVTYRSYPALDHFFFAGTGPATPAEYMRPSHVEADVVADIAAWCLKK